MAEISNLTAQTDAVAVGDLFAMVDISDTTEASTGTTKKLTAAQLASASIPQTAGTAVRYVSASFTGLSAPYYTTITLALAAATSGDLIVVYPGTYDEKVIGVDGVRLHMMSGAILNYTGATSEEAVGDNNTAMTFYIAGSGEIRRTPAATAANKRALRIQNASSVFYVQCRIVYSSGDSAISIEGGSSLIVEADTIESTVDSAIASSLGTEFLSCKARQILSVSTAGTISGQFGDGSVIDADVIRNTAVGGKALENVCCEDLDGVVHVRAKLIETTDTTSANTRTVYTAGGGSGYGIIEGAVIRGSADKAVVNHLVAQKLILRNCRIEALSNTTAAHGILLSSSSNNLILEGCSIVCTNASAESISAASAFDITIYGDVVTNRDKNANVTVRVGTLTVDSTYVL